MNKTTAFELRIRPVCACLAVLVGLCCAGCFRSLDTSKLTCGKQSSCPPSHYCSVEGRCVAGTTAYRCNHFAGWRERSRFLA
jgi:hypothetical protein